MKAAIFNGEGVQTPGALFVECYLDRAPAMLINIHHLGIHQKPLVQDRFPENSDEDRLRAINRRLLGPPGSVPVGFDMKPEKRALQFAIVLSLFRRSAPRQAAKKNGQNDVEAMGRTVHIS